MASKNGNNANKGRKRKQYLPYNKSAKKKGAYPLYPGVQGFFITCDGGREFQATQEAINVIDSFYEELIEGKDPSVTLSEKLNKPFNKKIKFSYSESSSDDDSDDDGEEEENKAEDEEKENKSDGDRDDGASKENSTNRKQDDEIDGAQTEEKTGRVNEGGEDEANEAKEPPEKKQCIQTDAPKCVVPDSVKEGGEDENEAKEPPEKKQCVQIDAPKCVVPDKVEEKSIDKLIEAELQELGDKNKRRFSKLDSGCNGVVFVQMRKRDGDPSPKDIVQHMMTSAASTRKHMSRFILRVLPIEVSCYASEEEISRAIKPLVAQHFPVETENPHKYAVLYDARANTGIDRMKIIDSVAKCIPAPHKVDLKNPDKNIVVQIVRTVCLIGVVEKYKELSKYNLRQLTSSS